MKLFEFEGKDLFARAGIPVPARVLVSSGKEAEAFLKEYPSVMVKAQVLAGKRGKAGLVKKFEDAHAVVSFIDSLIGKNFGEETIQKVLVEQALGISRENYLAVAFDTSLRCPVAMASRAGGMDVEEGHEEKITRHPINPLKGLRPFEARNLLVKAGFEGFSLVKSAEALVALYSVFESVGCRVAEINPLIVTPEDEIFAADAKVDLDPDAEFRRKNYSFPPRNVGKAPTPNELDAWAIDKNDHRGSSGSTYIDLDGDIGIIAAGGGASLTCMDSLLACGGKPANFTEHSGNPPREKVEKLTKVVLRKKGLNGVWFVGGTANFTDIYETLGGFLDGLRSIHPKPDYPIVIRRAGQKDKEAFEMLRKAKETEGYDIHLFGGDSSMTASAKVVVEKVNEYRKRKGPQ